MHTTHTPHSHTRFPSLLVSSADWSDIFEGVRRQGLRRNTLARHLRQVEQWLLGACDAAALTWSLTLHCHELLAERSRPHARVSPASASPAHFRSGSASECPGACASRSPKRPGRRVESTRCLYLLRLPTPPTPEPRVLCLPHGPSHRRLTCHRLPAPRSAFGSRRHRLATSTWVGLAQHCLTGCTPASWVASSSCASRTQTWSVARAPVRRP